MEDDAEDRMEKQKRASGWEGPAERIQRPRKDDNDEDMLSEVACQDDFDEAGWAEECGKKLDPKKVRQAREEELVELERRVYVEADVEECVKVTGKKPDEVGGRRQMLRRLLEQAQDRRPRAKLSTYAPVTHAGHEFAHKDCLPHVVHRLSTIEAPGRGSQERAAEGTSEYLRRTHLS